MNFLAFYAKKVEELEKSGQYFMAAIALGLHSRPPSSPALEFGEDNGGELQIPDSVDVAELIEAANEIDVLNAPIDVPSHVSKDGEPPKHAAKGVVDKVRRF
jgi:hypothetical protein